MLYGQSHLPGAVYAHLDHDLSGQVTATSGRHPLPDITSLAATLSKWGIGQGRQVVIYDDNGGVFAARLWWLLRWLGFETAAVLDGGFTHWQKLGLPLNAEIVQKTAAPFSPAPNDSLWVDSQDILHNVIKTSNFTLIDARDPERFSGAVEPLDKVAGHVPDAINFPFKYNLGSDGRFLNPLLLQQLIAQYIGPISAERCVHMCGSGVTACLNLLAFEVAGYAGAKLYAGSWSEWITDPSRPIAKDN